MPSTRRIIFLAKIIYIYMYIYTENSQIDLNSGILCGHFLMCILSLFHHPLKKKKKQIVNSNNKNLEKELMNNNKETNQESCSAVCTFLLTHPRSTFATKVSKRGFCSSNHV